MNSRWMDGKLWLKCQLIFFTYVLFLVGISCDLAAQERTTPPIDELPIENIASSIRLGDYLRRFESSHDQHRIFFLEKWVDGFYLNSADNGRRLGRVLKEKFEGSELDFILMDSKTLVVIKDPTLAIQRKNVLQSAYNRGKQIDTFVFGSEQSNRKESVLISGRVADIQTMESIPFLTVQVNGVSMGTTTDENGYYRLSLAPGKYALTYSFLDYDNAIVDLTAYESGTVNVEMVRKSLLLDEIVIEDKIERQLATSRTGRTSLSVPDIKRAPSFMGEPDIIKSIQTLPGVTAVSEAAAGFNVRGGSVDQNLILFDGLPVFNSAHVFGFFSAFNSDVTKDVSFYKGGIPAEYGGRSSSVLDIKSKDGDFEKWHLKSGIGLISSNVTIEGPLKKERTSVVGSFRSTYSNWLINSFRTNYVDLRNSRVNFNDGYVKVTHKSENDARFSLTGYRSSDSFRLVGDTTYSWTNFQFSGNYSKQISSALYLTVTAGTSSYGYKVSNSDSLSAGKLNFMIQTNTLTSTFHLDKGRHRYNFGWQSIQYLIDPGILSRIGNASTIKPVTLPRQRGLENALYLTDRLQLSSDLSVEAGLRVPIFNAYGSAIVNEYQEGQPRQPYSLINTIEYSGIQTSKVYAGLEPRISIQYLIQANTSLKIGYNRINQFIHLVTNSAAVTPTDIWRPSGPLTKPQRADQVSIGFFQDIGEKEISLGLEGFYKWITNALDFKNGAQLVLNDLLEQDLIQGKGKSYGMEFSMNKNAGKLTGGVNYTWSRALRQFNSTLTGESINRGEWFPSNYDQPHVVNLSWKYTINRRTSFTGNFSYHSGRPVTIPVSAISFENNLVINYSDRNQYRLPDYHRLDLALVVEGNYRRSKIWKGSWVFSAYNVYARKNPYALFFSISDRGIPTPNQLSIIGTVLPSISYNVKIF